jgi:hypothetical protein
MRFGDNDFQFYITKYLYSVHKLIIQLIIAKSCFLKNTYLITTIYY